MLVQSSSKIIESDQYRTVDAFLKILVKYIFSWTYLRGKVPTKLVTEKSLWAMSAFVKLQHHKIYLKLTVQPYHLPVTYNSYGVLTSFSAKPLETEGVGFEAP